MIKTITKIYAHHEFKIGDIVKWKESKSKSINFCYRIYDIMPQYHSYEVSNPGGPNYIGHDDHPYNYIRMQLITKLSEEDKKIYAKFIDTECKEIEKVKCKTNNINDWGVLLNEKHL